MCSRTTRRLLCAAGIWTSRPSTTNARRTLARWRSGSSGSTWAGSAACARTASLNDLDVGASAPSAIADQATLLRGGRRRRRPSRGRQAGRATRSRRDGRAEHHGGEDPQPVRLRREGRRAQASARWSQTATRNSSKVAERRYRFPRMTRYADDLALAHVLADTADAIAMARFRAQDLHVSTPSRT